jgi:hypothetical protein
VCTILSSLDDNPSLRELGFLDCDHVEGADLLGKMMDLLQVNPWLTEIDLTATPLEQEGKAAQVSTIGKECPRLYESGDGHASSTTQVYKSIFMWECILRQAPLLYLYKKHRFHVNFL